MAYRQILLIGVLICSLKFVTAEICTYTRTPNTKPTGDGDFQTGLNIDDCEAVCTTIPTCLATQFKNSACFTSTQTGTEQDPGSTHSLKSCSPAATTTVQPTSSTVEPTSSTVEPTSSTVEPTSSTSSSTVEPTSSTVEPTSSTVEPTSSTVEPTSSTVEPTSSSSTVEPTSSTVEPTSSTVEPTSSTVEPTSSTVGPTISTSKEICTYTRTPNTKPTGDGDFQTGLNIDDCEAVCTTIPTCLATQFKNSACFTSTQTGTEQDPGSTHSLKSCSPAATTTVEPTSSTVEPTSSTVEPTSSTVGPTISTSKEICTYTRTPNTKPTGDGDFQTGLNIDDCEAVCTTIPTCLATQFKNSACFTSTQTGTEQDPGSTHSLKSCSPAATTTVEPTSSTVEPTSSTVEPTSSTVGPTISTSKEICTYTRTPNTKPTGDGDFQTGLNIDDCEAVCTTIPTCLATQFKNSACFTSTQTGTEQDPGSTHSLKSCSPAATTTVQPTSSTVEPTSSTVEPTSSTVEPTSSTSSSTVEPTSSTVEPTSSTVEPTSSTVEPTSSTVEPTSSTVEPTSSTVEPTSSTVGPTISTSKGVCVMLKSEGKRGDTDFKVKILLTGSSCLYLCQLTDACRAITYDKTSCSLYSKDTSTRSLLGSNHVTRMFCVDGTECCWLNVSQTSGGNDHYATITNSLISCENICLKYLTCTGVYWDGKYCYIYTTQTTTSSQTGSVYSKKSCTQGAEQGLYKFNSLCSGSSVCRMCVNSSIVIFIAVFVDYYIKRYL